MSDRIPNAWGACSHCGKRKRNSTTHDLCGSCNRKVNNARYVREYAARAQAKRVSDVLGVVLTLEDLDLIHESMTEFYIACRRADALGHEMLPMARDDGPGTYITSCAKCEGFLVVDPCEAPPFYGRAYDTVCPGTPPVRPTKRRDPMDEAASSTSLAHEPVESDLSGLPYMLGKPWAWEQGSLETPGWEEYAPK